jgi:superfamily II DNA or RNA helicase
MNILRKNQIEAINISINNDFESGIHFHATGTGKSWIAMNIINEYNKKYPMNNIIWLCEKKSILIEQFNNDSLKLRNFEIIVNKFTVFNYAKNKNKNWINLINNYNTNTLLKPILLIINRAYLTSQDAYKNLNLVNGIGLIIHDECHSIINKSTKLFYNYILNMPNNEIKCIGFSATPPFEIDSNNKPFIKILSSYSIYDAFLDNIIVPPKIKWITTDEKLSDIDNVLIIKDLINTTDLIYKKIIVWCGMINYCYKIAELWSEYFDNYTLCIDTSLENADHRIKTYEDFYNLESNGILFCAGKHREGSDIKNLDCCIFLDNVKSRSAKLFVQSIGRVLRLDKSGEKKYGLIIDLKNKSSINVMTKINKYLNISNEIFPWKYSFDNISIKNHDSVIKINTLEMIISLPKKLSQEDFSDIELKEDDISIEDLKKLFIRKNSNEEIYVNRLNEELELISKKNLINHLIRALEILNITKNIPHVTRGSCGSSLVCYLLGISHVDPVKYNIKFARFLNEYRDNLPDIDLDFPHKFRDEVFFQLENKWTNKIARISNKVHYHDKSALRQAIRNSGMRKFISKYDLDKYIKKLPFNTKTFIMKEKKRLEETFKCYSLHCGGIVYYPLGIPKNLLLKSNRVKILNQIILDKYDIAKEKIFKVDILSSRALSQLYEINNYSNFSDNNYLDKKTYKLLSDGNNIGLTLSESPLIRLALMKIKPKNINDIAICLAIIRPAAATYKLSYEKELIFDDDAIDIIANILNISDAEADKYRRIFAKNDKKNIEEFKKLIKHLSDDEQEKLLNKLNKLSNYGFCKAHAYSYALLVYNLAYMKTHNPKEFWKATLNNCESSYKKWVHIHEAAQFDIYPKNDGSIYALNRQKKIYNLSIKEQLKKYGYWIGKDFYPNCYLDKDNNQIKFNGIVASVRFKSKNNIKTALIFLGISTSNYIHLNIKNFKSNCGYFIGIKGNGYYKSENDKLLNILSCDDYNTW